MVLFDGAAMADADHDAVGQRCAQRPVQARTPAPRRAQRSTRRGTPPSVWPAARGRTRSAAARRGRAPSPSRPPRPAGSTRWPSATRVERGFDCRVVEFTAAAGYETTERRSPSGTYGICDKNMVSSSGRRSVPEVNGHSCARLRSRVVLPAPEPPVITIESPGSSRTSSGSMKPTPAGVRTSTSSSSTEPSLLASAVKDGRSLAVSLAVISPSRRMIAAR